MSEQERKIQTKETQIKLNIMPDKETLEQFIRQMHGEEIKVVFNIKTGEFKWLEERDTQP